mmetsp:Transcript_7760/g.21938  ORF Transcript_7760/g.21938 Transcript_7760/m.21938 type:complete len:232 (-) Transcript_7760:577-1272(-)
MHPAHMQVRPVHVIRVRSPSAGQSRGGKGWPSKPKVSVVPELPAAGPVLQEVVTVLGVLERHEGGAADSLGAPLDPAKLLPKRLRLLGVAPEHPGVPQALQATTASAAPELLQLSVNLQALLRGAQLQGDVVPMVDHWRNVHLHGSRHILPHCPLLELLIDGSLQVLRNLVKVLTPELEGLPSLSVIHRQVAQPEGPMDAVRRALAQHGLLELPLQALDEDEGHKAAQGRV